MKLVLDGKVFPVLSHSRLRQDVMADQVPRADTRGNSLNSGFEAFIPVKPITGPVNAELRLRVRLENRQVFELPLGTVKLLPTLKVEQPQLQALPELPRLAICMATYNPPLDLFEDQIDSILKQTFEEWIC